MTTAGIVIIIAIVVALPIVFASWVDGIEVKDKSETLIYRQSENDERFNSNSGGDVSTNDGRVQGHDR
jgi:archaellum component FlaF (FlaF/FlaG flagellin family)